ncbi:hypothetical protein LIER_32293 [Lithospermum erythrorhizon]|uniref:SET domain-containing protein n=1 Tax=Lithospermum erythrorhizon TaxID=34254 RepID=A0AAV3RVW8_LITER
MGSRLRLLICITAIGSPFMLFVTLLVSSLMRTLKNEDEELEDEDDEHSVSYNEEALGPDANELYCRLGKDASEADAEEIINLAGTASLDDQKIQVQENIHFQINSFCSHIDGLLLPDLKTGEEPLTSLSGNTNTTRKSDLGLAVGGSAKLTDHHALPKTNALTRAQVSLRVKDLMGYTLQLRPSSIPHKDAGRGLFLDGEAEVGSVIAIYPGIIYSPAYYQYIPGYPKIDAQNPYLITRYDGTIINAQPWGEGGESLERWDGLSFPEAGENINSVGKGSDRIWKMLSKPLDARQLGARAEPLERRNPLAFAHFANHPAKDMVPNAMVCPYDFPLTEKNMRTYIPNISYGKAEEANMKRYGSFWFKSWKSENRVSDVPVLKSLVLVATRALSNEEVLLNYRLSNSKRRPSWYEPVDEEEDRRRWS